MPSNPLFGLLSKGALAALPSIQGLVNQGGLSASAILSQVRAAGFAIRTQTALDLIGVLTGNVNAARAIRTTPTDVPLDPQSYGTATNELLRNYSYKVKAFRTDPETGERTSRYITVSSDNALSRSQILIAAQGIAYTTEGSDKAPLEDAVVVDALKQAEEEV